ncbi:hypothetical protein CTEN210_08432 [Chaetoceros tenuissimus]|uniref:Uncharacterized protein n=1 Tax=Chaetoceros tenuissimus TaxID=426638 RepID=A0AAD3CTI4_9STRA|nr:hypothetical protein CTEN210_08432 [Chaetoceros tenuissimus]
MSRDLGVNLSLPSGTFNALEQERVKILSFQNEDLNDTDVEDAHSIASPKPFSEDEDSKMGEKGPDYISDEDREIMSFQPSDDDSEQNSIKSEEISSKSDASDQESRDEFDDLSLGPPKTMPSLLLDLEKLCGYQPMDKVEITGITNEMRDVLLGVSSQQGFTNEDNLNDPTSLDFALKSNELFETGIAEHYTYEQKEMEKSQEGVPLAIISYPEFLPIEGEGGATRLESTITMWKKMTKAHDIAVVDRLLKLLCECSRDLVWKYQMMMEIRRIAKEERIKKEERYRNQQLRIWRYEKRPEKLEKLYDVRETFEIRLHAQKEKYAAFVEEREGRVQRELSRRAENGIGTGGLAGLDWSANVTFGFGDDIDEVVEQILEERMNDLDDDGYHEDAPSQDSSGETTDSYKEEMAAPITRRFEEENGEIDIPLPLSSKQERRKRRAAAARKKERKNRQSREEKELEEQLRVKIRNAYAEEEAVRHMLISTDEKFALSTVLDLEKKLEKVDELLETLQEEEWEDEEEGILDDDESTAGDDTNDEDDGNPSVLDQILAMILGTIAKPKETSPQDHFVQLKNQHEEIITEWKKEFGKLPHLIEKNGVNSSEDKIPRKKPEEILECWDDDSLGSDEDDAVDDVAFEVKNMSIQPEVPKVPTPALGTTVLDDWEDGADLDDFFPEEKIKEAIAPPQAPKTSITGLRPGGRMK